MISKIYKPTLASIVRVGMNYESKEKLIRYVSACRPVDSRFSQTNFVAERIYRGLEQSACDERHLHT